MRFDNGAGDAESHVGPIGLGSKEDIEHLLRLLQGSPTQVSLTVTITWSFLAGCELMMSSRIVSTSFIASKKKSQAFIPFIVIVCLDLLRGMSWVSWKSRGRLPFNPAASE
jgi:hypothetical protein